MLEVAQPFIEERCMQMREVQGSLQRGETYQTTSSTCLPENILWRRGLSRSCLPERRCIGNNNVGGKLHTRRILIDNESLSDILFWNAFCKIGISVDKLRPAPTILKGSIALLVFVGMDLHIATTMIEFLVVRTRSTYNAIIDQPTLNVGVLLVPYGAG